MQYKMTKKLRMDILSGRVPVGDHDMDVVLRANDVDFEPLHRFFCDKSAPELRGFRFVGHIERGGKDSIRIYQNIDTERDLLIDGQLECFEWRQPTPKRISRQRALNYVYAPLTSKALHEIRCVPRAGVFAFKHNNWEGAHQTVELLKEPPLYDDVVAFRPRYGSHFVHSRTW
jgi:hypothetical protein